MIFSIIGGLIAFTLTMIILYISKPKIVRKHNDDLKPAKMVEISVLVGAVFTLAIFMFKKPVKYARSVGTVT